MFKYAFITKTMASLGLMFISLNFAGANQNLESLQSQVNFNGTHLIQPSIQSGMCGANSSQVSPPSLSMQVSRIAFSDNQTMSIVPLGISQNSCSPTREYPTRCTLKLIFFNIDSGQYETRDLGYNRGGPELPNVISWTSPDGSSHTVTSVEGTANSTTPGAGFCAAIDRFNLIPSDGCTFVADICRAGHCLGNFVPDRNPQRNFNVFELGRENARDACLAYQRTRASARTRCGQTCSGRSQDEQIVE